MRVRYLFLLLAPFWLLFFFLTPPFQTPDEDGHYAYVQSLSHGRYPVLPSTYAEIGRKQSPELQFLTGKFALSEIAFRENVLAHQQDGGNSEGLSDRTEASVQAYHPPLYYVTASVIYNVAQIAGFSPLEKYYATKITSGVFYCIFLLFALRIYRLFFSRQLSQGLLIVTAVQPMILMLATSINPEIAAIALFTAALFYVLRAYKNEALDIKTVAIIAVLSGLAALSKLSAIVFVPFFLTSLWFAFKIPLKKKFIFSGEYLLIGMAMLAPWLFFNFRHYGMLLPTNFGLIFSGVTAQSFALREVIQAVYADLSYGLQQIPGVFGWLDAPVFTAARIGYMVLLVGSIVGGIISMWKAPREQKWVSLLAVNALCWILLFLIYLSYDFHNKYVGFAMIQGRYALLATVPTFILIGFLFKRFPILTETLRTKILVMASISWYLFVVFYTLIPRYYV